MCGWRSRVAASRFLRRRSYSRRALAPAAPRSISRSAIAEVIGRAAVRLKDPITEAETSKLLAGLLVGQVGKNDLVEFVVILRRGGPPDAFVAVDVGQVHEGSQPV